MSLKRLWNITLQLAMLQRFWNIPGSFGAVWAFRKHKYRRKWKQYLNKYLKSIFIKATVESLNKFFYC